MFQSSAFQTALERAVLECLVEPHVVDGVVTRTINGPAFTVIVANSVEQVVERCSCETAEKKQNYNLLNKAVVIHNSKGEDKFQPTKME